MTSRPSSSTGTPSAQLVSRYSDVLGFLGVQGDTAARHLGHDARGLADLVGADARRHAEPDDGAAAGLLGQLGGVPVRDHEAVAQDREPVREVLRLVHVVRGQQDRLAEIAQTFDHVPRVAARLGVEAGRRLVEEQEVGVADDAERDVDPALLPARELADPGVALRVEPDERDRVVDVARLRVVAARTSRRSRAPCRRDRPRSPGGRGRCARARPGSAGPDRRRAPGRRRRCVCGSPRGSRSWSSCPRRWCRGARRSRRTRPRSRCPSRPRDARRTCGARRR